MMTTIVGTMVEVTAIMKHVMVPSTAKSAIGSPAATASSRPALWRGEWRLHPRPKIVGCGEADRAPGSRTRRGH